jgi:glutamate mutase epsilon subunit
MCRQDTEVRQLLDSTNRDINMVEKTIMNQIEIIDREHHKIEDEIHREINQVKSYTDSRIDKVVASGTLKEPTRQIING